MTVESEKKCWNCVWFKRLDSAYGKCEKHDEKVTQHQSCQAFKEK